MVLPVVCWESCEPRCRRLSVDLDEDGICDTVDPCVGDYDACGVCNGNCTADVDADGIVTTGTVCGVVGCLRSRLHRRL